jgi:hypothetical protein
MLILSQLLPADFTLCEPCSHGQAAEAERALSRKGTVSPALCGRLPWPGRPPGAGAARPPAELERGTRLRQKICFVRKELLRTC